VPADTLRVWERRYAVVEPERTEGGGRLYRQQDVARLGLIKRLVDAGHAISTVANLTLEDLEARVAAAQSARVDAQPLRPGPVRLVIVGSSLPLRFDEALRNLDAESFVLAGSFFEMSEFEGAARDLRADVLVVEVSTLNDQELSKVRRMQRLCGARRLAVVYGFARSDVISQLSGPGAVALRFPVEWEELRRMCIPELRPPAPAVQAGDFESALGAPIPPRMFDDRQLAIASAASTTVKCECPHHLADLVTSLVRFEQYSAECENRGREDAALHAFLHVTTAKARLMLEEALQKLVEVEGIDVVGRQ
jgi:DNA-binding transcriptional MerR regulator